MFKIAGATVIVALFLLSSSCTSNSDKTVHQVNGKLNFGVLRYDSAALEYRLDSIHNRGLVIQFVASDAANSTSPWKLIAYAYDTLNDHNNSWMPDTLQVIADSIPKTFSGKITVGNNEVTREQLMNVVRDEKGLRISYDYVVFTPVVEGVFNHLVYMMRAMKGNTPAPGGQTQMTSPMPPSRNWY
jgi:hypothetical protein